MRWRVVELWSTAEICDNDVMLAAEGQSISLLDVKMEQEPLVVMRGSFVWYADDKKKKLVMAAVLVLWL